ncbi:hypothetical protein DRK59_17825 [Salmonella enterica subsp. diarizonae]|nr:hypothetical protein [Salmonella enterica]ECE0110127.1 hypothetical protein [Salmonella enterica subsp. diarizonae]EAQ6116045.1 hypothetical protein [Salmonella enterica]ECC6252405.1 hypothetical protein [Salmonella enterica]ECF6071137.1 hypothetical protein [Salmonella enterica subsp. diarizonae]
MDNTYICEQKLVSRRHTNNLEKWRDNDHTSHILYDLHADETRKLNKIYLFFKQIYFNLLLSFVSPAHRQRVIPSEHHHRKKIIT